ncbi:MAG: response regulator [Anaerolineae bacterium]|nr:response regulator [Anaerolineae bacterium]
MAEPRVLYIEDHYENRLLVKRVLMAEGITVIEAGTATEGIAAARREVPDVILMDINLPEMDGLTATVKLREFKELQHIPIVALTANVMQEHLEQAKKAGCDGFIAKPIDIDKLPDQIRNYLGSRGHARS